MTEEIVAALINGRWITTSRAEICAALEADVPIEFISRARMTFMSCLDLGPQWEKLANSPTLFSVEDVTVT